MHADCGADLTDIHMHLFRELRPDFLYFIQEIGGNLNNWTICYPYGNYNEDTIEILKKKHCQFGLTTRVDLASTDSEEEDAVFKLPRLDTNDFPRQADATTNEWFQKTN